MVSTLFTMAIVINGGGSGDGDDGHLYVVLPGLKLANVDQAALNSWRSSSCNPSAVILGVCVCVCL